MSSSYPPSFTSGIFNTTAFSNSGNLTLDEAAKYFLKLTGGTVNYLNVINNLDCASLTVAGATLNVAAITGVTAGICSASKALIVDSGKTINSITSLTSSILIASTTLTVNGVDVGSTIEPLVGITLGTIAASKAVTVNSSSQINSNLQLASTRKILMNNSSSSGAYIDMGATASDRCISLFSDASSYYGFGAGGSQTRMFSKSHFGFYTGATQSVTGTEIASISSAGLLTLTSIVVAGTISGITTLTATTLAGLLSTPVQTGITSLGSLTGLTTAGLTLGATAITATGTEINYLDLTTGAGTAEPSKALVLNASSNIIGINSLTATTLITTNLTLGATAITATGIEINKLAGITDGTVLANKVLIPDLNKDLANLRNLGVAGIISMNVASTTISMTVPSSVSRSNLVWTGDTGTQWEYGMRGSSNTPANALYWYSGGYRMVLFSGGQLTVGGQQAPSTHTLQVNHSSGSCIQMTYNLTSNLCNFTLSSGGILTIAPSGATTNLSASTASTSNTTGALTLAGGIGISNTTDASSITNGGSFTTAGGAAFAKSIWCGTGMTVNKSTSGGLFSAYCGTSYISISGLLNSDISIMTAGTTSLNIGTGSSIAMTIDGINQSIYNIGSLTATTLSATNLYGLIGTAAQTSITSLGTLTGLTVSGLTTTTTLNLGGTLITATGAEINYCDLTTGAGTAEASKALVLDASRNIININNITSSYLTISTAINSGNCLASFGAINVGPIITSYGISSIKGTASYPSVYFGSTNSILWAEGSHASPIEFEIGISSLTKATSTNGARIGTMTLNDLSFNTNAVERMLIRSSGAVAIKNYLQVGDSVDTSRMVSILDNTMTGGTSRYLTLGKQNANGDQAEIAFVYVAANDDTNALSLGFYGGERMRLTRWGSLLVNSTQNVYSGTKTKFAAEAAGATEWAAIFKNTSATNSKTLGFINNSSSEVGSISWGTGTTSFNTTSDYRLKKNVVPMTNCLELINKLKPVRYNWINEYNEPAEGFLAHELQEIIPLIVIGKKDAVYADGSINPQSIDYGKLTPHLVSAVQDLTKINIALSKKIEELEQKVKNILSYDDLDKHIKTAIKSILKDYTIE